jgi:hypothetical protein
MVKIRKLHFDDDVRYPYREIYLVGSYNFYIINTP